MKSICCVAISVLIFSCIYAVPTKDQNVQVDGIFEDLINNTINDLLKNLPEDVTVNATNIPINVANVTGDISFDLIDIKGHKDIVATHIKVDIFTKRLNLTLALPKFTVKIGQYDINLTVNGNFPIYGAGDIEIELDDIEVKIEGEADFQDGITVKDLSVLLHLGGAKFDIQGLLNDKDFSKRVTDFLNTYFVTLVNVVAEPVSKILSPILEVIINHILHPNPIQELFIEAENTYKLN